MADTETREELIKRRLGEICRRSDFPSFSEHIQRVMQTTEREDTSIHVITNVILRDFSLTLRLLRTANSPMYNRSGRSIHSVTHAVTLLGLEAVRNLAGSLLLFEHYRGGSPGLKELMLLSLLSANHAFHASAESRYPRLEEAYICGMYRNLGEVLVACYFPREYAAMLVQMKDRSVSQRDAARRALGFSLEDLGQACARHWRMPEPVSGSIGAWEPVRCLPDSIEQLHNITAFAHRLTAAFYRRDAARAKSSVKLLVETYRPILGLGIEETQRIADNSIRDTMDTFAALQMPLNDLRLRRQMRAAVALVAQSASLPPEDDPVFEPPEENLLRKLTLEIEQAVAADGSFDLNSTLIMVLEAICRGGGFDRAVFCLVNPERTHVKARVGLGGDIDALLERFHYRVTGPGSPIALALTLKQDVMIDNQRDGRFEHTELVRSLKPASFGLLPVVVDGIAIGCLYFDRHTAGASIEAEERKALASLRDLAARALARTRPADSSAVMVR